jgi:uncharacterized membrane protein YqaE (UPF0057 family)
MEVLALIVLAVILPVAAVFLALALYEEFWMR